MTARRTASTLVALAAAPVLAMPMIALTAAPASAVERSTRCDGGRVQLDVEKDDGRFEVDLDLDGPRDSRWKIVLKQDGATYVNTTRRVDDDGDIDVERTRSDTAGRDVFTARANKIGTPGGCTLRIVRR